MSSPPGLTLPRALMVVALYALVHAMTRLISSGNLGEDDPLDNLLIQQLSAGYGIEHGPLYDWALWLIQKITGPTLPGFLALKYSLLVVMAGLLYSLTRRMTQSSLWAFIAVESMASVYQIFWRFHEGFTHRVGAMALTLALVWALLRVAEGRRQRDVLLFGLLAGFGLLSEHIVAFSLAALLLAAWLQPAMRRRVFTTRLPLALLPALLIASPYLLWLQADNTRLEALQEVLFPPLPGHSGQALRASLRDALTFPIFVLSPYILVVLATFPAIFRLLGRPAAAGTAPDEIDTSRFIGTFLLIELAGHLIYNGLVYSRVGYAVHSILPMLVVAIAWLTGKAWQTRPSDKRVRVFIWILLAFTVTAYGVRSGNLFIYEPFCSRCRWGTPYDDLAEQLKQHGFRQGMIVTNDVHTGGNLRRFFPDSHIVLNSEPATFKSAEDQGREPVAIVWPNTAAPAGIPEFARPFIPAGAEAFRISQFHLSWKHRLKPAGYRHSDWSAILIEPVTKAAPSP